MEPQGIRKVIAERQMEGAIIYLYEQIEALKEELGAKSTPPYVAPVEEHQGEEN